MTEKRFEIADYPTDIIDTVTGKEYRMSSYYPHMEIICDLLNKQHEKIKELQCNLESRSQEDYIEYLKSEIEQLKTLNQRLKEGILWLLEILCKKDPKSDIEFWCQTFFDCNYQTAKEKYGELSKVLWESNNND